MNNIDKFNLIASKYDTDERREIAKIIAENIISYIEIKKGKTAIDFGCGTGSVGINLLEEFKSIFFIDASENMIQEIKQKIEKRSIKNADVLCYDLTINDLLDVKTDYIIISQTLLHIEDTKLILERLKSLLNKDGHIIIVDFDKNKDIISKDVHNGFSQKELTNTLKGIGFTKIKSKTFYKGEKIFMNKDASLFILDAVKEF